jgi:hypothetical protein
MLEPIPAPSALPASDQPPPFVYHVRAPRQRTCLSGKLVYGDVGSAPILTLDCAIRDISEGGAKITLEKPQPLPPEVFLISVKHKIVYQAQVMWMKFPARGLKFLHAYMLKGAMPEELMFLRDLSLALDGRSGFGLVR